MSWFSFGEKSVGSIALQDTIPDSEKRESQEFAKEWRKILQAVEDLQRSPELFLQFSEKVAEILRTENWFQELPREQGAVVIGDLHGDYATLQRILLDSGILEDLLAGKTERSLLVLGDMVDRGRQSIAVVTLLTYLKVTWPNQVILLQGDHETGNVKQHTFPDELETQFDQGDLYQVAKILELWTQDILPQLPVLVRSADTNPGNLGVLLAHAGLPFDAAGALKRASSRKLDTGSDEETTLLAQSQWLDLSDQATVDQIYEWLTSKGFDAELSLLTARSNSLLTAESKHWLQAGLHTHQLVPNIWRIFDPEKSNALLIDDILTAIQGNLWILSEVGLQAVLESWQCHTLLRGHQVPDKLSLPVRKALQGMVATLHSTGESPDAASQYQALTPQYAILAAGTHRARVISL